ncbi:MAG TPA: tetratricopeptide repeat protein, partial [Sedimentisphaerales bacterium]|nr:tetratricopeptide repeat protein [Sedimentisphaerales bacterium]
MQVTQEAQTLLFSQSLPAVEQIDTFAAAINGSEAAKVEFRALIEQRAAEKAQSVATGIGLYIVGNYSKAVEKLMGGRESMQKFVFLGRALRACKKYNEALEAFEMALKQKGDAQKMTLEKAETLTQAGRFDEAKKI